MMRQPLGGPGRPQPSPSDPPLGGPGHPPTDPPLGGPGRLPSSISGPHLGAPGRLPSSLCSSGQVGPGRPSCPPPSADRLVGLLSQVDQLLLAAQHDAATASRLAASAAAPTAGRRHPQPLHVSAEETDGGGAARSGLEGLQDAGSVDTPLNERLLALYAAETLKETRRYGTLF